MVGMGQGVNKGWLSMDPWKCEKYEIRHFLALLGHFKGTSGTDIPLNGTKRLKNGPYRQVWIHEHMQICQYVPYINVWTYVDICICYL